MKGITKALLAILGIGTVATVVVMASNKKPKYRIVFTVSTGSTSDNYYENIKQAKRALENDYQKEEKPVLQERIGNTEKWKDVDHK